MPLAPPLWSHLPARARTLLGLAGFAAANGLLAAISVVVLSTSSGVVILCLNGGFAAGVMRVMPARARPALVAAQALGTPLGVLAAGRTAGDAIAVEVVSVLAAITYPLAHAALGGGATPRLWEPRGALRLIAASALSGLVAAPAAVATVAMVWPSVDPWFTLWTSFAIVTTSVQLLAPLVTVLTRLRPRILAGKGRLETTAWLGTIAVSSTYAAGSGEELIFIPLAHVMLAAARLGPGGGAIASLVATLPFTLALANDRGAFAAGADHAALAVVLLFAATTSVVGWFVALVVGELAESQSALGDANVDLARSGDELRGAAANVEALLDAIPDVYVLVDAHGQAREPRGGDAALRAALTSDAAGLARLREWPAPSGGTLEVSLAHDGAELVAEARAAELATGGRLLLVRDVTERRRQQQELGAQALELERSNAELAQFAYVASHDLREPLRQVAGFAGLLGRSYRGRLDETADEYIDLVLSGVTRMNSLIRDLLALSELRREAVRLEPCDLGALVEAVGKDERRRLQEIGGRIDVSGELPIVAGDRTQLQQLLANLIGNAIKYRSTRPLVIRISAVVRAERIYVHVADNGIGFEVAHASRIFGMFQRLHPRDVYEGTGIGLALCRRVVENHGGLIWADSAPAVGSTFTFTLRGAPLQGQRVA